MQENLRQIREKIKPGGMMETNDTTLISQECIGYGRYRIYHQGKFIGFLNELEGTLAVYRDNKDDASNLSLDPAILLLRFSVLKVRYPDGRKRGAKIFLKKDLN